ncbi:MAG: dTDP-4-dehydrorhamnose reductase [Proteobacteria bacterium]|nr:MAG: dTDP-4-dehydrorhamnose reductase [Pseudomonadota bacterium]
MQDKTRVLITGAGGQLGYELQRTAPANVNVIAAHRADLDISDASAVNAFVDQHRPNAIINAAAYTAVDKAEDEREQATAINETGAKNLAWAARDKGIKLLQVSTDFVFSGEAHSPMTVDTVCQPQGFYGESKLQGELAIREILGDQACIMRTAWLYSAHGNNFVKTMLRLMRERDQLGVIADQIGTPTWAHGLALALWQALKVNALGTYHWTDAGVASWYDFAQAIMEEGVALSLLEQPIDLQPLTTADYPTPASRPAYSVLDKTTTWQALNLSGEHWRVALRKMMTELTQRD